MALRDWRRPPPPDHRGGESGTFGHRRINGRLSPLARACLSVGTGLFLLFIAGLSGYAWTKVSGDATFAKDGVLRLNGEMKVIGVRMDNFEVNQKALLDGQIALDQGQKDIIKLLFIRPQNRKLSDIGPEED